MGKGLHNQVGFISGEWSPKLDARVDSPKYATALRQCLNMIPFKTGGLTRRPGTQKIGAVKQVLGATCARLISFTFSPTTTYVLEFGDHYIRFYSNGQQAMVNTAPLWVSLQYYPIGSYVTDPTNGLVYLAFTPSHSTLEPHLNLFNWRQTNILECPVTPYGANPFGGSIYDTDVFQIVPCQINDVIYIVHPDYPPWILTRITDTHWTFNAVVFDVPALLDQNATDTIITPSAVLGGNITLTASAPAWLVSHSYSLANTIEDTGVIYQCINANVSGATFAADLALGYWKAIPIFVSGMAFSTWQLATLRNSASVEYIGDATTGFADGSSGVIQCRGSWEVHTYGVWAGTIEIERSLDQGVTYNSVRTITGLFDRNVDIQGKADLLGWYRITVSNASAPASPSPTAPRVVFECVDAFLYGQVYITSTPTDYTATAKVIVQLNDPNPIAPAWVSGQAYLAADEASYNFINYTALNNVMSADAPPDDPTNWALTAPGGTKYWSEAAWSLYRGFPRAICAYQQRVIYGSTAYEPQRIWGTVTNDLENFALGDQSLATDSFAFDLNAVSRGPIQWLIGQTDLFAGFSGAEWVINSGSTNQSGGGSGSAITATNVNAVEHSSWGSTPYVQPAVVGDALMFTQRQSTSLRQMLFSIYTNKYMSQDLTALADHLFPSGIVQIAYQSRWRKQSLVWVVTQQGTLCGMTYELDQEVFGWHRHQTGFSQVNPDRGFESVCVIDGHGTADDEVWVVANRTVGGQQVRFVERMNPFNWEEVFTSAPYPAVPSLPDAFYVDCGITTSTSGTRIVTGLDYLEGREVIGLADGNAFGPLTVSSGRITLPAQYPLSVAKIQVGLAIRYAGQPMRIDQDPRAGNTQGLNKATTDLFLRVMNSCGGEVANGTNGVGINLPVPLPYTPSNSSTGEKVFIGPPSDLRITPKAQPTIDADPIVIVTGLDALPITILGLVWKVDVISTP